MWGRHRQSWTIYQNLDRKNCIFFILRFTKLLGSIGLQLLSNMDNFWHLFLQNFFHIPSLFYFLRNIVILVTILGLYYIRTIVTCILGHLSCKDHWCSINFFLFFFPVFHCGYSITISSFAVTNLMLISYDVSFFNLRHGFYL